MHQTSRRLTGLVVIAPDIGDPPGILNICIKGDDRNSILKQLIDFFADTLIVVGR